MLKLRTLSNRQEGIYRFKKRVSWKMVFNSPYIFTMSAILTRAHWMMGWLLGHMVSWGANTFKVAYECDTLTSEMSIELFSKWKVDPLKGFLKRGGIILSGRKAELAEKAYYAWKLKLEVTKTTQDQEDDISTHSLTAQRYLKLYHSIKCPSKTRESKALKGRETEQRTAHVEMSRTVGVV